ncbi:MAG TPA: lytic transglycosylase domain-containing protein [Puia sp.]|nr:lytic transglycosylase domain-containing protein [Puia sp.]
MCNKRLLLLGLTLVVLSGWVYPSNDPGPAAGHNFPHSSADTERLAGLTAPGALAKANPQLTFSSELFLATEIGGTNGARLNPKALNFIEDYVKENWDELQLVRTTGGPYFHLIENILAQYDLPKELKYLAVIESNLKPSARSRVGAVGPWQLMPQTARDLGLKVNRNVDERRNYVKSTRAAALYLKDLYRQLGDWLLVIAAYNTGTANVFHAIKKSGSRNFWDLQYYLPLESRIHVKKFIGTQYVFEGQGSVTTLTRDEAMDQLSGSAMYVFHRQLSPAEVNGARTVTVSGKYTADVIARYVMMDSVEFNRYNPDFDKVMASSNNSYDLKLPADKMDLFEANKYQILTASMQQLNANNDLAQVAVK